MSQSRLEGLAYRMLGSVADAEDVVQDARLRLLKQRTPPDNEEAWLFRVVTNLALDRLRQRKRQRETYPGPWLPEPLPTEPVALPDDPQGMAELAESLSMGLVLMLERLSPAERVVFVLREGFDLGFDEIGGLVDASSAACRQRFRRARLRLDDPGASDQPASQQASTREQKEVLERLLVAVAEQDSESLVALFSEDCVAYADGGGVVSAAIRPIVDPARIAQVTMHIANKLGDEGPLEYRWLALNGGVGLAVMQNGELLSSLQVEVQDGMIQRLYMVRNPEKLGHLTRVLK